MAELITSISGGITTHRCEGALTGRANKLAPRAHPCPRSKRSVHFYWSPKNAP